MLFSLLLFLLGMGALNHDRVGFASANPSRLFTRPLNLINQLKCYFNLLQ